MKRGHLCINLSEERLSCGYLEREWYREQQSAKALGARLLLTQELKQEDAASWGQGGQDQGALKPMSCSFCLRKEVLWEGGGSRTLVALASHWFSQESSSLTCKTGRCFLTSPCEAAEAMGAEVRTEPSCGACASPRLSLLPFAAKCLVPLPTPSPCISRSPHPTPCWLEDRAGS